MTFSELSVERDAVGRFSEKRGSAPEVSLDYSAPPTLLSIGSPGAITFEEYLNLPEPSTTPRTVPLHTSDENRALFEHRKKLAEEYELALWRDGGAPQGIDYLYRYQKPLLDFDAAHPEIESLGTRIVEPTPTIIAPSPGRDADGRKVWQADGPDGLTLTARRAGFRRFAVASDDGETWEGRSPEEAIANAYEGVQTDEAREARIAAGVTNEVRADLRYKMGHITASERASRPNHW